jgi:L-iditol 2-dehydrogenase
MDLRCDMKAIVKDSKGVGLRDFPKPNIFNPHDILIKIALCGLCRTDLNVANGKIKCRDPLVLGHEFSGSIEALGPHVKGFAIGDQVAVMPILFCDECSECRLNRHSTCTNATMLGMHHHGAFAEYIVVPSKSVYKIPETLSYKKAAYLEPIAASLAVLNAGISQNERGLIYGKNRIADLTRLVLKAHGITNVVQHEGPIEENAFDYIIETFANKEVMEWIFKGVRPGGKIILKSRQVIPVEINLHTIVRKEIQLIGTHYGSFEDAIGLLTSGRLQIDHLLGEVYPLEKFSPLENGESTKIFYSAFDQDVWNR